MKHTGSFEDLQAIVRAVGFVIDETEDKGNCKQIRTRDGAILNWFESTGTLQFQGKKVPKEKLENAIATYTGTPAAVAVAPDGTTSGIPAPPPIDSAYSKKVFVVHGHDATAREQLELILHRLGLNPFVLQNTAGEGLTIIEALEREICPTKNAARFGIVLLTPDDIGYSKSARAAEAQPRARQNVVLEMGMLIPALGRPNVAILKKGHLEVPSDAQGILYIPFNDHVKETVAKLVDRLRAAGFVMNPENISRAAS
jgi:predicted nucleotide-binding protein